MYIYCAYLYILTDASQLESIWVVQMAVVIGNNTWSFNFIKIARFGTFSNIFFHFLLVVIDPVSEKGSSSVKCCFG